MKVKDLIAKLLELDPTQEMEVVGYSASGYDFEDWYFEECEPNIVDFIQAKDGDYDRAKEYHKKELPRVKKIYIG